MVTCFAAPREWDVANATILMSGLNHLAFSLGIAYLDPSVLGFGAESAGATRRGFDKKKQ